MARSFGFMVALLAVGLVAVGCSSKTDSTVTPSSSGSTQGPSTAAPSTGPRTSILPRAAEAKLALAIGKDLYAQAKLDEAEVQLKVASAGGLPEADGLLLKLRTEKKAKEKITVARQKLREGDHDGALTELAAVPSSSVLNPMAQQLVGEITAAKAKAQEELSRKMLEALKNEMKDEEPAKDDASPAAPE